MPAARKKQSKAAAPAAPAPEELATPVQETVAVSSASKKQKGGSKKSIAPVGNTKGATKKIDKKKGQKKPADPNKKPIVRVNYYVTMPKSHVRAVALKKFPGSIGAAATVGLTALSDAFVKWMHQRAYSRPHQSFSKRVLKMQTEGKFMGKDTPRRPYDEDELPKGFRIQSDDLRHALDTDPGLVGVKETLGADNIEFLGASIEPTGKQQLEEHKRLVKEVKENSKLAHQQRRVYNQLAEQLDGKAKKIAAKINSLKAVKA